MSDGKFSRISPVQDISIVVKDIDWPVLMAIAIHKMLDEQVDMGAVASHHIANTPSRTVAAYQDMFAGSKMQVHDALSTTFESHSDQMIHVKEISYYSTCAHHLLPFFGTCSFAYIPQGQIVGLSKIPRLVDMYARRPQVQEELTSQIVKEFYNYVNPLGCGLLMRGYHMCCMSRGIKQPTSYTETTELAGCFHEPSVKNEFLASAGSTHHVWR